MPHDPFTKVSLFRVSLYHRGSTRFLLEESSKALEWPDYSKVLYIAPTPNKLRDAQRIFHSLVKNPYIPPNFFTFKQFSRHLFNMKMPGKAIPQKMLPVLISEISGKSLGYSASLAELLKELKQYQPLKDISTIRDEFLEVFKKLGIPDDTLARLNSALGIFEELQAILSNNNYFDEDDILNLGPSLIKHFSCNYPVLIVDGFYDMTVSEKNLLTELITNSDKTLISIPVDKNNPVSAGFANFIKTAFKTEEQYLDQNIRHELSFVKYSGIEEEIEGIARHIKNSYISGRLKAEDSIIVTFPKIKTYADLTERIFRKYGLPCNISHLKPASHKPAIRDVLYLLDSVSGDFPRAKFTTVLTSRLFKHIPDEVREQMSSISITSGVIKGKTSWENIIPTTGDKAISGSVRHVISDLFNILSTMIKIRDSARAEIFRKEINRVLSELHFEADNDDIQILQDSMDNISLFDKISGSKDLSLKKYADILRHLLSTADYKHNDETIQIMDSHESRGLEPEYLYFCGLRDGDMPSKPPIDHILPDSARTEYGLVTLGKYLSTQKLNFLRITGSSLNIHLSYPSVDGDNLFLPSPYLPWGSEIPEKVFGIFSEEEHQVRQGTGEFSDSINDMLLDSRTANILKKKELSMPLRVTSVDSFRKCPRRFFIEKILKLEASEIAEYEIEAKTLGTIIHSFMEKLFKEPFDTLSEKAPSVLDSVLDDYTIDAYWKKLLKETFLGLLPEIIEIENEIREDGFQPIEAEKSIREEVMPGISLKGKIDRVDKCNDIYRILDYKTGAVIIGSETIKKGKELQLPLYAAMMKAQGMNIDKAGIYSLKDIGIKWIPTKRDKNSIDDYISSALKFLEETVKEMGEGKFYARPSEEFYCLSCAESPFCPYINSKGADKNE